MHELMFQAVSRSESLKGMSERSKLIPCSIYSNNKVKIRVSVMDESFYDRFCIYARIHNSTMLT